MVIFFKEFLIRKEAVVVKRHWHPVNLFMLNKELTVNLLRAKVQTVQGKNCGTQIFIMEDLNLSLLTLFVRAYFNKRLSSLWAIFLQWSQSIGIPGGCWQKRFWTLSSSSTRRALNWWICHCLRFIKVPVFTSGHFHSGRGNAQAAPVGSLVSGCYVIAVKVWEIYLAARFLGLFYVLCALVLIQYWYWLWGWWRVFLWVLYHFFPQICILNLTLFYSLLD